MRKNKKFSPECKSIRYAWLLLAVLVMLGVGTQGCHELQSATDGGGSQDGFDGDQDGGDEGGDPGGDEGGDSGGDTGGDSEPDPGWEFCDGSLGPGDDFTLVIPAQTQACSLDILPGACSAQGVDLVRALGHKGRARLVAGTIQLSRTLSNFEADLIDLIELGPGGVQATPEGPGSFTCQHQGTAQDGTFRYEFNQIFRHDTERVLFGLGMSFEVQGGQPVDTSVTLDEATLTMGPARLWIDRPDDVLTLSTCQYSLYKCMVHEFEFDNQDQLKAETCGFCPPGFICKSDQGAMPRAEFTSTETQYMDDHFQLVHDWRHHNWGQDLLIVLNQPIGSIHGLYLGAECFREFGFVEVQYLNATWEPVETHQVISHTTHVGW